MISRKRRLTGSQRIGHLYGWTVWVGVSVMVVAIALIALRLDKQGEEQRSGAEQSYAPIMGTFIGDPENPGYPKEWRVPSIRAAQTRVDFSLLVPEHSVANSTTLIAAFVLPGRAVALDFAAPAEPLKYIRQEYIEVYQATWLEEMSPVEALKYDIENAPSPVKELTQIGGIPALTVDAHSPKDDEAANPAFVKFVLDGVEIQISGGEDLGMLIEIAESLITQAR